MKVKNMIDLLRIMNFDQVADIFDRTYPIFSSKITLWWKFQQNSLRKLEVGMLKCGYLQCSTARLYYLEPTRASYESISNVNLSFCTPRNIFDGKSWRSVFSQEFLRNSTTLNTVHWAKKGYCVVVLKLNCKTKLHLRKYIRSLLTLAKTSAMQVWRQTWMHIVC